MRSEEEEPDGKLWEQPKGKAKTVTMGQREGNYKDVQETELTKLHPDSKIIFTALS